MPTTVERRTNPTPDGLTCWGPGPLITTTWWAVSGLLAVLGVVLIVQGHVFGDRLTGCCLLVLPPLCVAHSLRRRRIWVDGDVLVVRNTLRTYCLQRSSIRGVRVQKSWIRIYPRQGRAVSAGIPVTPELLAAIDPAYDSDPRSN